MTFPFISIAAGERPMATSRVEILRSKRSSRRLVPVLLCALVLAGCAGLTEPKEAPAAAAQNTGLAPQKARITDQRIQADRKTLDGLQQRLRLLNEAGVPQNNYSLAKAQCWLDTAKTQYLENDRTGYVEESLHESISIVQAFEADKTASAGQETPLIANSTRLREDLWARLAGLRGNPSTLHCVARSVACAEVRLVRAGHAEQQTGWRQATPHVAMVEDAVRLATEEAASCVISAPQSPVAVTSPAPLAPVAAVPPAAMTREKETFVLPVDVLFTFDKAGPNDLLPGGLERLREVAERLKKYSHIDSVDYIGHTDRFGTTPYNDALSLARARTVREYMESAGVKAEHSTASGRGNGEPIVQCSTQPPKAQQVLCLQPNRRVAIEVTGIR